MNFLKYLFKPKPKSFGNISSIELAKLIPIKRLDTNTIYLIHPLKHLTDYNYFLPNKKQVEEFLKYDLTNYKQYKKESFDCDDFALVLLGKLKNHFKGFAFGFGMSDSHAFNVFIDNEKQLWIIEPQNDKIFKYDKNNKKYKLNMVLI